MQPRTAARRKAALVLALAMAAAMLIPAGAVGAAAKLDLCEGPNLSLPKCNPPIEMLGVPGPEDAGADLLGAPDIGLMYKCVKGDCRIDLFEQTDASTGSAGSDYSPDAFCTIVDYTCGPLAGIMKAPEEPEMGIMMCQAARRSEDEVSVWCE